MDHSAPRLVPRAPAAVARLGGPTLAFIVAIAVSIAWIAPFDRFFAEATFALPALRAVLIVALAAVGAWLAPRVSLEVGQHGLRRPLLFPLAVSLGVAVWCAAIDVAMVRRVGHAGAYAALIQGGPLGPRLIYYSLRAFNENVIYRLFATTLLAWAFARLAGHRRDPAPAAAIVAAVVIAQLVNILGNVTFGGGPVTAFSVAYDSLRYIAPGIVWGLLYWRFGFVTTEIACTSVHLFFQPLASAGLTLIHGL
ncbi:MAG TPA: hypothetical protein VG166_13880 [Caulobacteraceae bacterium]|nr:hypothetical protein [Caulobacteraceae bacterium]